MSIEETVQDTSPGYFYRVLNRAQYAAIALATLATLAAGPTPAHASIDPFTYLQPSYSKKAAVPNPHTLWGNIVGAEGIDNGTKAIILWDSGMADIYSSDMTSVIGTMNFGTGKTGVTEVPSTLYGLGAKYAVSDVSGIEFYDATGVYKGGTNIYGTNSGVLDIEWDPANSRIIVATTTGIGTLNDDGMLTMIREGNPSGIEYINMNDGTQDMLQKACYFDRVNADGSIDDSGSFTTNLSLVCTGIAYTKDRVINTVSGGWYIYDPFDFQNVMDYSVPEPATGILLSIGTMLLPFRKKQEE